MKSYTITVNGNVYDVTVEENGAVSAPAAAPRRAAAPAPAAAPTALPILAAAPTAAPTTRKKMLLTRTAGREDSTRSLAPTIPWA